MYALLSAIVALSCAMAAARRLGWAEAPTALDPVALLGALRQAPAGSTALRDRLGMSPDLEWERDLLDAARAADDGVRDAAAEEQLLELRWRVVRWERVPRVCASIATSAGFLFATIVLLQGLATPAEPEGARTLLFAALTPFALGLAGTAFCVAVHLRVRRILPQRLADYGRLVEAVRVGRDGESRALA